MSGSTLTQGNAARTNTRGLGRCAGALLLTTALASTASGQEIYEGFDYPVGSLLGQSGGQNMDAAGWTLDAYPVVAPSLTYQDLTVSGNRAAQSYEGYAYPGNFREYDPAAYSSLVNGGEFWFSCLFNHGGNVFFSYLVLNPGGERVHLRNDGLMSAAGGHKFGAFVNGETTFLVGRLNVTGPSDDGANDTITLWTNPTPGLALPDTPPALTRSFAFEQAADAGFRIQTQSGGGELSIDEIRLGASYASVSPTTPVVEDQTTYLLSFGRGTAAPAPWKNWNAWNFPGIGAVVSVPDAETGGQPATVTVTDSFGHLRPWHSGTPTTTETFFGYPIPSGATATTFTAYHSPGAYFTLEVGDLEPDTDYAFEVWMVGRYPDAVNHAQTWTLTGAPGSSYTATKEGFDASTPVRSTASGTIELRFDFPVGASDLSAVECVGWQKSISLDSDGDNLLDADEINIYGTDPNLADTDGDGVDDGVEVDEGTDPLDTDSDDDGLDDGQEAALGTNPLDPDTDGDGLDDGDEIDATTDPFDPDTDDDGVGDAEEVAAGTNPIEPDSDGDGLDDGCEAALGTDPLDPDSDDDGLEDGSEFVTHGTNPLIADTDGDGLDDGAEVGTYATDPLDVDTDDDGLGDGAEVNAHGSDPLVVDTDGDGLDDGVEVNTYGTDPAATDTDGDGLDDGEEVSVYLTDPTAPDTDGDGLDDGDEVDIHGTSPAVADTDADGLDDGEEVTLAAGSGCPDPNDADSDDDGVSDGDEVDQLRMPCNAEPVVTCFVEQLTDIGSTADVTLSGVGTTDAEDAVGNLTFEWTIDDGAGEIDASGVTVQEMLGYGEYTVTLTVTDTGGGVGTCSTVITIDPADLSVFDCEKIEVKFDDDPDDRDRVKISGEIALPMGVDFTELDPMALIMLDAAGLDFLGVGIAPITFEEHGGDGHHWKYRDNDGTLGITKFDIDWKGARFRFKDSDVPVKLESELISSNQTVLEMKYKMNDAGGAFTVTIDGTVIVVDEDGLVTSSEPSVTIEVKQNGKKVELNLPFAMNESSTVDFGGALAGAGAVDASDHYTNSLGRFKLEAKSDAAWTASVDAPDRSVNMSILAGGIYPGDCGADATDLEVHGDKWKAKE